MNDQRLEALRASMKENGIDVYIVPTADYHESEYVGEYFKTRVFLTGFTGSAGIAVVTDTEAALFTDGRYFIQAERQIKGSGFTLFRMGVKGVPTVNEFVRDNLPTGGAIGFDGRTVNAGWGLELQKIADRRNASIRSDVDLAGDLWTDRPEISKEKAWVLPESFAGESVQSKLTRIREKMDEKKADVHVVTSLDDICWMLNLRGNDAGHFRVVLSYLLLTKKGCVLYVHQEALTREVREHLEKNNVAAAPYESIYDVLEALSEKEHCTVLLDAKKVNYRLYAALKEGCEIVDSVNPAYLMKAIKNKTELQNIRMAHIKDGVAMVRWLMWLSDAMNEGVQTEITVSDRMAEFRAEQENFIDLSFDTIAAYGANAAMMHYKAAPETAAVLQKEGFLLVDCGGHYLEGSTDITRTVALGTPTEEEKMLFTTVLRSNLNLAAAKFLYGCTGQNLDILSRGPLWELGIDYRCGTGHGVGYILNIHEGPNGFRYKTVPERNDSAVLEAGMVTTDEPGVYTEGKIGIRIENELICQEIEENEYGKFMGFETCTYCPIDLKAVDPELLSKREKKLLNDYHQMVYETLSPYLTKEETLWLRYETREV